MDRGVLSRMRASVSVHTENLVRIEFLTLSTSVARRLSPCATQSFCCLPSFVSGSKAACTFRPRSSPCATKSSSFDGLKKVVVHLRAADRFFWVWLSRLGSGSRSALQHGQTETVISGIATGSGGIGLGEAGGVGQGGPRCSEEVQDLIGEKSVATPLWGAPRIHGELLKLGIEVSQATVAKYIVRQRKPPLRPCALFSTIT